MFSGCEGSWERRQYSVIHVQAIPLHKSEAAAHLSTGIVPTSGTGMRRVKSERVIVIKLAGICNHHGRVTSEHKS